MDYSHLRDWHDQQKESRLSGRYINLYHIKPILESLSDLFKVSIAGNSVNNLPVYKVEFGTGPLKILAWSQMHGNESTTTKALFDLFKWFEFNRANPQVVGFLNSFSFSIIPMLNPDGATSYTRLNATQTDLNRDAQDRSQPESRILREEYDQFKPDYCLNLHGQRTIFGVGDPPNSSVISFLSPAQDELRTVTLSRKRGMQVIIDITEMLQEFIPNQVGRYDDSFNINCVGDTFQQLGTPTILFEAGHFPMDYERETTRSLIFLSYLKTLDSIRLENEWPEPDSNPYFAIPENQKCFFDWIIREIDIPGRGVTDVAVQYEEKLENGHIEFIPKIQETGNLKDFHGHQEIDAKKKSPIRKEENDWKVGEILEEFSLNDEITTTFSLKYRKSL